MVRELVSGIIALVSSGKFCRMQNRTPTPKTDTLVTFREPQSER